jgi:carbamoyltransferase
VYILGLRSGHDAGACLIKDNIILADVSEERFSRIKNDSSFPVEAINYCLDVAKISSDQLDVISIAADTLYEEFYNFFEFKNKAEPKKYKPKFPRSLIYKNRKKFDLPIYIDKFKLSNSCEIDLVKHHVCHAAAAYYTCPLKGAAPVLAVIMDGIGDGESVSIYRCNGNNLEKLYSVNGLGSLAWFYGVATEGYGWKHGSDEWKIMGLAPYGTPKIEAFHGLYPTYENGKLEEGVQYQPFSRYNDHGCNHYHSRASFSFYEISQNMSPENYAASVQKIAELQADKIVYPWMERTGLSDVVFGGGFFLNVKYNQKIWESGKLNSQWVYPNPGDSGLAFGAAAYSINSRRQAPLFFEYGDGCFGPEFSDDYIENILIDRQIQYDTSENVFADVATLLQAGNVIGWFQGRMETGPRALGHRSILMSATDEKNKDIVNKKIKYREGFRPFCPSIIDIDYEKYLRSTRDDEYMISSFQASDLAAKEIPAVVHFDRTARPQKVLPHTQPIYYKLLENYRKLTGIGAIMNTSFNIKGEPIVCSPREALKCFYDTGIDVLVLSKFIIKK